MSATHRIITNSPREVPILSKCDSERVKMPTKAFYSQRLLSSLYTILLRRFCMLAGIVSEIGGGGDLERV